MGKTVRTFISMDIPITDEIKDIIRIMKETDNVRPVSLGQIHVTLKFLGDTDEKKIPQLCSRLQEAFEGFGPVDLAMKGMGAFPNVRNPKVIWMGFEESDRLIKAAEKVTSVLDSMKLDYDGKRFSPHVTAGRITGKTDITDIIESHKDMEFCRYTCSVIRVMGSELTPKGAVHTILGRIAL